MTETHSTFSETWERLASLRPRLLPSVNVHRQHFRGALWYVLQNPASNEYFRLSDGAYHFAAMLDGRRSVIQVWRLCTDTFKDVAPTQGEVVELLTRLHAANLLQGVAAPDAEALFRRHRSRRWREVKGFVRNFLFIRIPLWDPDRFLDRWVPVLGKIFTGYGFALWGAIIIAGLWAVGGHTKDLTRQAAGVLDPQNVPLLYLALVLLKIFHEMGHAFACKRFGKLSGAGGEVHQMGVTLLVFTPLPFVEASSAWAIRSKWHRIMVGASGMLVELAIAALAAILWTYTAEGTSLHALAYNVMFIASVSTLIFNGNPFLRYDAYYIRLDLIEIPNLDSRSKAYLSFLIKRRLWGLTGAHDPSHSPGERVWLVIYAVAALIVRITVSAGIVIFLGSRFFMLGIGVGMFMAITWLLLPLRNLLRHLAIAPELEGVRIRAVTATGAIGVLLATVVGLWPAPDRLRIEGVVEPVSYAIIHMKTDGFVEDFLASGRQTGPQGPVLISAASPVLKSRYDQLEAEYHRLQIQLKHARSREPAAVQITEEKLAAMQEQMDRSRQELANLKLRPPIKGTWVAPDIDRMRGQYLKQGTRVGTVADLDRLRIRAVAGQTVAAQVIREARPMVDIRVKGQPDRSLRGRIETIIPAGQDRLPSVALGFAGGGSIRTTLDDPEGRQTAEPFFEILVAPQTAAHMLLMPGQSMVLRLETVPKPLIVQAYKSLQQLFQMRFQV